MANKNDRRKRERAIARGLADGTLVLVPCTGEAHKNPHIDHCMVCAPRWGEMVVKASK